MGCPGFRVILKEPAVRMLIVLVVWYPSMIRYGRKANANSELPALKTTYCLPLT